MDVKNSAGVLLLINEDASDTETKWAAWFLVMILFVIILLYFSNYFESNKCSFTSIDKLDCNSKRLVK